MLVGLVRMSRWSLVLLAFATTAVGASLAGVSLTGSMWWWMASANGLLSAASMIFNDWHDVEEDRLNRPARAIPSGAVSRGVAFGASLALFGVAVVLAFVADDGLGAVTALAVVVSVAYTLWLKRVPIAGNATVGIVAAFPLWCWQILGEAQLVALVLAGSCALFVCGKEILKTGEDAVGDAAAGIATVATLAGVVAANRLGAALMGIAVALAWWPVALGAADDAYVALLAVCSLAVAGLVVHTLASAASSTSASRRYSMLGHALLFVMLAAIAAGIDGAAA